MIKVLTASTYELDDAEKAVQEILSQIAPQTALLKNSAAMLFCHIKFIEMGVMEKVCKSLPFDVVGCTSLYFALPNIEGEIMLAVTVLTSDDTDSRRAYATPLPRKMPRATLTRCIRKPLPL